MEFEEDALHSREESVNIVQLELWGEIFFIIHQRIEIPQ